MQKEEFLIESIIIESLFVTMPRLSGKNVNLLLNIASHLPGKLSGDSSKLGAVFKSILDHGITFVEQGCILLHILEEAAPPRQGVIVLRCEMEEIGQIGEKPFESEIVRTLVDDMGGSMNTEVLSKEHHVIKISIPLDYAKDTSTVLESTQARQLKGKKVLFLSEDEYMLESLGYLLYAVQMDCVHVRHPDEVLEKLSKSKERGAPFDLLICDHVSDNMGMLQVAHQYRSISPETQGLLMVSTFNGNYLRENDIIEVGSLEFIDRIIIPSEFISRICSFLNDESGITNNWNMDDWTIQSEDEGLTLNLDVPDIILDDLGLEDFACFEGIDEL